MNDEQSFGRSKNIYSSLLPSYLIKIFRRKEERKDSSFRLRLFSGRIWKIKFLKCKRQKVTVPIDRIRLGTRLISKIARDAVATVSLRMNGANSGHRVHSWKILEEEEARETRSLVLLFRIR